MGARVIQGQLYRITSQVSWGVKFVECVTEDELMEYLVANYYGNPITVAHICYDGSKPKVAVYTNPYYKQLVKNRQAFK